MPTQAQEWRTFKGLQLPVDRKRIEEPYVVAGANFLVDVDGPYSGFGRTWIDEQGLTDARAFQTLNTIDETENYIFAHDSILRFDVDSRQLYPVYTHTSRTLFYPWTRAVVGGKLYLCNFEIGILVWDPVAGTWTVLSGSNVPTTVYAICESFGRLVILSDTRVTWSSIDDASNSGLAPSTVTGAGFQGLSLLTSKAVPLMVLPYHGGFLTYTRQGIMRSEFVQAANPFRHTVLTREHILLNPWAITFYGDTVAESHVFLTHRGLFKTDGDKRPELWQPLMSEHIYRNLLPGIDHKSGEFTTALAYSTDTGWFSVSIAQDSRTRVYGIAFVLYQDEWGILSRGHTGLSEITLNSGAFQGPWYCMCDTDGVLWRFTESDADRVYPAFGHWYTDVRTYFEFPPQWYGAGSTVSIFSDMGVLTDENHSTAIAAGVWDLCFQTAEVLGDLTHTTSEAETPVGTSPTVYVTSGILQDSVVFVSPAVIPSTAAPLDAYILVGPFRLIQDQRINLLAQLQEGIVGMLDSGTSDTVEDYLEDYDFEVTEDWNALTTIEDWGEAAGDNTEYSMTFEGTIDGYKIWTVNGQTQVVIPDVVVQHGRTRHIAGNVAGQYVYGRFTAYNIGETFHLKHIRLNFANAGKLL